MQGIPRRCHARRRSAADRALARSVVLVQSQDFCGRGEVDFLALDEALHRLAEVDPNLVRVVELRFFAGLTNEEAAETMGITAIAAKREWQFAKAWLNRRLS